MEETLRQYSRYFIGEEIKEEFSNGLFALEKNWKGPITENAGIGDTLKLFQNLEKTASDALLGNWRFQQALYRAYYDAYVQGRLLYETALENDALAELASANEKGSLVVIQNAEIILDRLHDDPVTLSWRKRIFELAEALFQSIGMQLSVERYQAVEIHRGANLDTLDFPLNNGLWMKNKFGRIRQQAVENERLQAIDEIIHWTDPGPGGFYDDLGDVAREPHLVRGPGFTTDPGFFESTLDGCEVVTDLNHVDGIPADYYRTSWRTRAQTFYETPLTMHYENLQAKGRYRLRVVYGADVEKPVPKIRLVAGEQDQCEVHPLMDRPVPFRPLQFDIPPEATATGELTLKWYAEPGFGGNGHGVHVAEVRIVRENST